MTMTRFRISRRTRVNLDDTVAPGLTAIYLDDRS